jgi:hypothetical protein
MLNAIFQITNFAYFYLPNAAKHPPHRLSNFKLQQNSAAVKMSLSKLQKKYESLTFSCVPKE